MLYYSKELKLHNEYLKNSLLPFINSFFTFFFSKYKKKGSKTKNPTKNLTPLNKYGPINSMPVSRAINVVQQIKVHPSALKIEIDVLEEGKPVGLYFAAERFKRIYVKIEHKDIKAVVLFLSLMFTSFLASFSKKTISSF